MPLMWHWCGLGHETHPDPVLNSFVSATLLLLTVGLNTLAGRAALRLGFPSEFPVDSPSYLATSGALVSKCQLPLGH